MAENIGAIVSGEAKPHGVVTYVMAGVTVAMLLATTTWATVLIRHEALPGFCQRPPGERHGALCRRTRAAAWYQALEVMPQVPELKARGLCRRRALKRADLHLREDPEAGRREVDAGNGLPRPAHV